MGYRVVVVGATGNVGREMVAILAEPTLILVFVGITLLAKAMLPFVVNHLLVAEPSIYWGPTHLFLGRSDDLTI